MKKTILLLLSIFMLSLFIGCDIKTISETDTNFQTAKINFNNNEQNTTIETQDVDEKKDIIDSPSIKNKVSFNVPFADQAPHKNWGDPYQEACEEASIIMANQYIKDNQSEDLEKDYINQEILDMVLWQENNFNGHYDLDVQSTLELFQKFYNYQGGKIISINSPDDLKQILSDGHIIIAPTYGRALDNPNFTAPGPVYHMLVIKGYDETNFITNDPGVWQGKNFTYSFNNLFESIYDLPEEAKWKNGYIKSNPNLMMNGAKQVIII